MNRLAFLPKLADKILATDCAFVVTGGGGWIGQATLEMLDSALGDELTQRVSVFGSSNRDLTLRSGRTIPSRELKHITDISNRPTYFLHYAFLTKDKLADRSVESFVAANQKITNMVVAAIEKSTALGIFTPSSGAVYKKGTHILDDNLQTNAYGMMKLADEKIFSELTAKKNSPLCMPRLFNLSGPFINKIDLYALASMIKAVQDGKPITIRAAHRVVRSYIHVADLINLAIDMLLNPQPDDCPIFDTAGDEVVEMNDLAELIRATIGTPATTIERPAMIADKDDVYVGDATVMKDMLGSRSLNLSSLQKQIRDTAEYMQMSRDESSRI